ncbi:MAG: S41 family peptidase [Elusimicrobia bacterium]|nr:S41 family peptidase [Elusimicrobiota bacterium]
MFKRIRLLSVAAVLVAAGLVLQTDRKLYSKEEKDVEDVEKQLRLFSDAFVLIKENYVEEITVEELIYGALNGMVDSLDPYSQFMEPDEADIVKSDTEGEFGGLGIRITTRDGYIVVVTPLPDTPAYRMGIMPGDKIVKIEGEPAGGISLRDAVKKLRGPKGTKVAISIDREGEDELLDFTVTRDIIVPEKVYSNIMDNNIGYVRLVEFTEDAPDKLKKALMEFKEKNLDGIIFDLRNNPGGLLNAAVEVSEFFIKKGQLIVYTKGRRADQNRQFHSSKDPIVGDVPLVVLINKGSASGSEIVAGCIKDISRGLIMGEKSFGKASVQSIIDLEDDSALRLTTAKYYTPSGISIHDKGIDPDIEIPLTKEQRIQIIKQQEEIYNLPEKEKQEREKEKVSDPQVDRAHDVLVARKIFLEHDADKEKQQEKQ